MSDLLELHKWCSEHIAKHINMMMAERDPVCWGDIPAFGYGDVVELAAELIDVILNREFETCDPPSSGWCSDPTCMICRKEAQVWPKRGQCAECPYKLNGVFAETGCPNCPNRCARCGAEKGDTIALCDGVCVDCDGRRSGAAA